MMPYGPLMIEHRLIEKLIPVIWTATGAARREGRIDPVFVDFIIDFVRTYADRCHHGKEEDILFRELDRKNLAPALRGVMNELIDEHRLGRRMVADLRSAVDDYRKGNGESLSSVISGLEALATFYPVHILKEDRDFFPPSMEYLSPTEREAMLAEEREFDQKLVHDLYRAKLAEVSLTAARPATEAGTL